MATRRSLGSSFQDQNNQEGAKEDGRKEEVFEEGETTIDTCNLTGQNVIAAVNILSLTRGVVKVLPNGVSLTRVLFRNRHVISWQRCLCTGSAIDLTPFAYLSSLSSQLSSLFPLSFSLKKEETVSSGWCMVI